MVKKGFYNIMNKATFLTIFGVSLGMISGGVASANTVTVKSGDTVSDIARENNTTVSSIQELNNLQNVNLIFPGDTLQVNSQVQSTNAPSQPVAGSQSNSNIVTHNSPQADSKGSQGISTTSGDYYAGLIANKESGGSYTAQNGQYIGKYQLSNSYLNGDYSASNQEKVFKNYVANRYGSTQAAWAHEQQYGWY